MLTKVDPEKGVFSNETYCSGMDYSGLKLVSMFIWVFESVL